MKTLNLHDISGPIPPPLPLTLLGSGSSYEQRAHAAEEEWESKPGPGPQNTKRKDKNQATSCVWAAMWLTLQGPWFLPEASLPLFQVSTHQTFLESVRLSHLHGHHSGPCTTTSLLDSPMEVQLPPCPFSAQQPGWTDPPLSSDALQFEVGSPVALASEPTMAWASSLGVREEQQCG